MVVETRTKLLHRALEKGKLLDVQAHPCVRQRKCITKKKNRRASVPQIFQNYVVYSHALHKQRGCLGGLNARVGDRFRKKSTTLGGFDKTSPQSTYFALNQAALGQNRGDLGLKIENESGKFIGGGEKWRIRVWTIWKNNVSYQPNFFFTTYIRGDRADCGESIVRCDECLRIRVAGICSSDNLRSTMWKLEIRIATRPSCPIRH